MAIKGSNIEDLFREGLANHEMPVNPNVWTGVQASISTSVGATAAAGSSGLAMSLTSAAIGVVLASVAVVGEIQYQNQGSQPEPTHQIEHIAVEVEAVLTIDTITREEAKRVIAEIEATPEFVEVESEAEAILESQTSEEADQEIAYSEPNQEIEVDNAALETKAKNEPTQSEPQKADESASQSTEDDDESNKAGNLEEPGLDEEPLSVNSNTPTTSLVDLGIPEYEAISIYPSGNGPHACFELPNSEHISTFLIQIFERNTGKSLFRSNDPNFQWCGSDEKGNRLEGYQVVFFTIDAFDENGVQYTGIKAKSSITVHGD